MCNRCRLPWNFTYGLSIGLRRNLIPIGFAIENIGKRPITWSYHIVAERLIAYKYGSIPGVQLQTIEKSLDTIIEKFEVLKDELILVLSLEGKKKLKR